MQSDNVRKTPIFMEPYRKDIDELYAGLSVKRNVGPGYYDILRPKSSATKYCDFSHSEQRPNVKHSYASEITVNRPECVIAPKLYKTEKRIETQSFTPGAAYFPEKTCKCITICNRDRFRQTHNYEKEVERKIKYGQHKAEQEEYWVPKGYTFSSDRNINDIEWLKIIDFDI